MRQSEIASDNLIRESTLLFTRPCPRIVSVDPIAAAIMSQMPHPRCNCGESGPGRARMKGIVYLLASAVLGSVIAGNAASQSVHPVSGPFSSEELKAFREVGAIDTHTHVFAADPAFVAMLKKLNLHILDILFV